MRNGGGRERAATYEAGQRREMLTGPDRSSGHVQHCWSIFLTALERFSLTCRNWEDISRKYHGIILSTTQNWPTEETVPKGNFTLICYKITQLTIIEAASKFKHRNSKHLALKWRQSIKLGQLETQLLIIVVPGLKILQLLRSRLSSSNEIRRFNRLLSKKIKRKGLQSEIFEFSSDQLLSPSGLAQ